jgi:hypothetical protein
VLNSNANVTEANGVIHRRIRNFCNPNSCCCGRQGEFLLQKCSGRCVHNHSVTPMTILKYDIVLGIRSERVLSNIFSD